LIVQLVTSIYGYTVYYFGHNNGCHSYPLSLGVPKEVAEDDPCPSNEILAI
jgi:hypothetical protein